MNDILASTRMAPRPSCRANLARLVVVAPLLGLAASSSIGCRTAGESDLVARELRMQEDQLYAMEDYLTQYQHLLRKCRAQNVALKHRLDELEEELPEPPAPTRRTNGARQPAQSTTPSVEPSPETDTVPPTVPENLELPDVPPLQETTQDDTELPGADAARTDSEVLAASHVSEPTSVEQIDADIAQIEAGADPDSMSNEPYPPTAPAVQLASHSEVDAAKSQDAPRQLVVAVEIMANDAGGGKRMVVDVKPLSDSEGPTHFSGAVSLMVLAPGEGGRPQSLARWDFSAEHAQAAAEESSGDALRFYLELPSDVSANSPVQLWARLLPAAGEKLLGFAEIDLQQAGRYSSAPEPPAAAAIAEKETDQAPTLQAAQSASEEGPVQVVEHEVAEPRRKVPVDVTDGTWSIARPGESPKLAKTDREPTGSWRTASEPLPAFLVSSMQTERTQRPPQPHRRRPRVAQTAHAAPAQPPAPRRFEVPTWTPDRTGQSAASKNTRPSRTAAVPSWSPDR